MSKAINTSNVTPDAGFFQFLLSELKPKGKIFTPFNIISFPIIILGLVIIYFRFKNGIGSVTNLTQEVPWGLWIGFDVVTGVAFAGGAYVLVFMVNILNLQKYKPILRITVLNGFLAYLFYSAALLLDLGRPLNVVNVVIGNNYGVSSVLFLVGWHFLLYMLALFIEFSPAVAEWMNAKKMHRYLTAISMGAVIFGITLSVLHQSGIGALFLMAKDKIHPLWYNSYLPLLFVVSSVFAGISMVILEGSISHKVFANYMDKTNHKQHDDILIGLSKICALGMFVYMALLVLVFVHEKNWAYINTPYGYWFLVEVIGFVMIPMLMFTYAYRHHNTLIIKISSIMTLIGILLNRMNISIICYRWEDVERYVPSWQEFIVTLTIVFIEIWVLRWIVRRMPVLRSGPKWAAGAH
ncbi:MAG TPA: polysulfide reductase NrfD [Bacteroidales bacterium]|nr:polysulfide reductase NrfD [Bacteroidales bacterium]